MRTRSIEARVNALLDGLYAGTLDETAWHRAIASMTDMAGGCATQLFALNPQSQSVLRDEGWNMPPEVAHEYAHHWAERDVIVQPAMALPVGRPTPEHALIDPAEFRRSAILNEFMKRIDHPHLLVAWLHKSPAKAVAVSIKGSARHGLFSDQEVSFVSRVLPHLTRALEIRDQLEQMKLQVETLSSTLVGYDRGLFLLDPLGRIVEMSDAAQAWLRVRNGPIQRGRNGELRLPESAARGLAHWLQYGRPLIGANNAVLRIPRDNGPELTALVAPLPQGPVSWFRASARWLVVLFEPSSAPPVSLDLLMGDLGITRREAEITLQLVEGNSPDEIAGKFGISRMTVRTHLKHLLAKAGVRSQSALVRRVLLGPAAQRLSLKPPVE